MDELQEGGFSMSIALKTCLNVCSRMLQVQKSVSLIPCRTLASFHRALLLATRPPLECSTTAARSWRLEVAWAHL